MVSAAREWLPCVTSLQTHVRKGSMMRDQSSVGTSVKNPSLNTMSGRVISAPACPAVRTVCRSDEPVKYTPATTVILPAREAKCDLPCVDCKGTRAPGHGLTLAWRLGEGEFCRTDARRICLQKRLVIGGDGACREVDIDANAKPRLEQCDEAVVAIRSHHLQLHAPAARINTVIVLLTIRTKYLADEHQCDGAARRSGLVVAGQWSMAGRDNRNCECESMEQHCQLTSRSTESEGSPAVNLFAL